MAKKQYEDTEYDVTMTNKSGQVFTDHTSAATLEEARTNIRVYWPVNQYTITSIKRAKHGGALNESGS